MGLAECCCSGSMGEAGGRFVVCSRSGAGLVLLALERREKVFGFAVRKRTAAAWGQL